MSARPSRTQIGRRRFLAASALAVGGAAGVPVLGACNASGGSGGSDTVTLTVMYRNNELTQEHIAEFEAQNSGIKINFLEHDDTRLTAMLASNQPPDFVRGAAVGSSGNNARGLATAPGSTSWSWRWRCCSLGRSCGWCSPRSRPRRSGCAARVPPENSDGRTSLRRSPTSTFRRTRPTRSSCPLSMLFSSPSPARPWDSAPPIA